jgi:hypothetical protein
MGINGYLLNGLHSEVIDEIRGNGSIGESKSRAAILDVDLPAGGPPANADSSTGQMLLVLSRSPITALESLSLLGEVKLLEERALAAQLR